MEEQSDRLEAVLREHEALRNELVDKSRLQVSIFVAYLSALTIAYAMVITNSAFDIMAAFPIISIALLYRIMWKQTIITEISLYIQYELEQQKIPLLIGQVNPPRKDAKEHKFSNLWLGWQTSYYLNKDRIPKFYDKSLVWLFVYISALPPIIFNFCNVISYYFINAHPMLPIRSSLSIEINIIFLVIDFYLGLFAYKLIKKHVIDRRKLWKP